MKKCTAYHPEILSRLVDNDLPCGEMDRLKAHLAHCPACRAIVDRYHFLEHTVAGTVAQGMGEVTAVDLEAQVMEKILAPGRLTSRKSFLWGKIINGMRGGKFYLQMASFAAILILSTLFLQDQRHPPQPSRASAIVNSIDGDMASVMILETGKENHTIIWYKET